SRPARRLAPEALRPLPSPAGGARANSLARTIHEPAACERDLPADRCVAGPGRSSTCHRHACVATGSRALRSTGITRSRLAVHEYSGLDETLHEGERRVGDFSPAAVDRERVPAVGHLDDLGHALVA